MWRVLNSTQTYLWWARKIIIRVAEPYSQSQKLGKERDPLRTSYQDRFQLGEF